VDRGSAGSLVTVRLLSGPGGDDVAVPVAWKMVLQVAAGDIGQLTDFGGSPAGG
jgi:hypothetical protein